MNPTLLDLPEAFETNRLTIRVARPGDGALVQAAYVEAGEHVHRWVPFADAKLTVAQVEESVRTRYSMFLMRELFFFSIFLKSASALVGLIGLRSLDWEVPKFQVSYLLVPRFEGHGYCTEALEGLTRFAFDELGAARIQILADRQNERGWRVAERAGYVFEGVLRNYLRDGEGDLVDKRVYAKIQMAS